ncbi:protein of unknown function [Methylacidimicrobium sp. AP8]|uniref:hypothetical protein n=1 Tax=Methylacidimicrobium sp. AP8 TaxID=2730359 RepID=UPI0018C0DCCB|nr:hypothetical protein [Methylacidimicrobium sp. AP8]CAB4244016.1 protein of unknown function [Methylacidimicrobium sp. AP8]
MRFPSLSKHRVPLLALIAALAAVLLLLLLLTAILSHFLGSETLRAYLERQMNSRLKDYAVRVGRAYFHPLLLDKNLLVRKNGFLYARGFPRAVSGPCASLPALVPAVSPCGLRPRPPPFRA